MSKFKPYSRRALNHRRMAWVQRNTKVVSLAVGMMFGLNVLVTLLLLAAWPAGTARAYTLGLVHTTVVAAILFILNSTFLANDREAIWHVRGAWGEENTRDELRRAQRKRLIWGWVDSINLQAGDIDHVVITRHGGLVAIDSKWRSQTDVNDTAAMARDASRTRARAEGVTRTLLKAERGTHRARIPSVNVQSAVVVWGPTQHTVPDGAQVNDVPFIAGQQLLSWLSSLQGQDIPKETATDLLQRLKGYRASSWQDS